MYFVHVVDPPANALARPLQFRLGPYRQRDHAEAIAARARETNDGTKTRIIQTDDNEYHTDRGS